jgi:OmpA-OmpF porin, OOP family
MKSSTAYLVALVAVAALSQACTTTSNQPLFFEADTLDADAYVRKVDQFVIIADASMSMADRAHSQRKIGVAGDFLSAANQTLPDLGFEAGLRTFGRGLCDSRGKTLSIVEISNYISSAFGDGVTRVQCPGGNSPLNLALDAAGGDLEAKGRPTAIIVVSDGLHMGANEIAAAEALKSAFGDSLTIYAVQVGDSKKGRTLLEQVVAAGGSGYLKPAHELASADAMATWVSDVFLYPDDDGDGVANHLDRCPGTPKGVTVDAEGCPVDTDGDGVADYLDKCPGTPAGVKVNADGCPIDSDGDGVPDASDLCPDTPRGMAVDANGCPDTDGDGVPDNLDKCPDTPRGVPVDEAGCPLAGITVVTDGWSVEGKVLFALNKATLTPEAMDLLGRVAAFLQKNPRYVVEIQGHTDSTGPMAWNMRLSEMRAAAVKENLVQRGVDAGRLTTKGFGPNEPIAPNNTAEGRAKNRRVDFKPTER